MTHRNFVVGIECRKMLQEAVQKQLPISVTNQLNKQWQVYKSCFLALQSNRLVVAMPIPDQNHCYAEPTQGQEIAVSFKKGYHKCLFTTRIIGQTQFELQTGETVPALLILSPTQLEKIQRRAYNRSSAPPGEPITVTFWPSDSPNRTGDNKWRGRLYDLSAGGLGLTMRRSELPDIPPGRQVEICFVPLPGQESLPLQARFRHATELPETGQFMLGFQLLGLEMDEVGRSLLRRIGRIVIARGRDATDVPLIHTFGQHVLKSFKVWTDEMPADVRTSSAA